MAQIIKLKRSATPGSIPATSDLALGEIAVNTYDGKIYMKKNVGGSESVVQIQATTSPSSVISTFTYTTTANQTVFTGNDDNGNALSYVSSAVEVFLNGIRLTATSDYTTTSAAVLTLGSPAQAGDTLTVVAYNQKVGNGNLAVNSFTGDGSTTDFTLTVTPEDENNTQLYIDGVYQSKSTYTINGTTLSLASAPASAAAIEISIGTRELSLNTASGLALPDNVKVTWGGSNDLEIYHDGSNSIINEKGTGSLQLQVGGSAVQTITSTGISVAGDIDATGEIGGTSDGGAF
tara:strand:- start:3000 stop:3872 length:873 start_codon:yes stop_codon:yes gene_type:complete